MQRNIDGAFGSEAVLIYGAQALELIHKAAWYGNINRLGHNARLYKEVVFVSVLFYRRGLGYCERLNVGRFNIHHIDGRDAALETVVIYSVGPYRKGGKGKVAVKGNGAGVFGVVTCGGSAVRGVVTCGIVKLCALGQGFNRNCRAADLNGRHCGHTAKGRAVVGPEVVNLAVNRNPRAGSYRKLPAVLVIIHACEGGNIGEGYFTCRIFVGFIGKFAVIVENIRPIIVSRKVIFNLYL